MNRPRLPVKRIPVSTGRRGGGSGEPALHPGPPEGTREAPLLLDSREVARLLGVSRTKAFQMISTGTIPVMRIGRCARVPRVALESWISAQTTSARSEARLGDGHVLKSRLPHAGI
jgi:excisionase family DNA binding protein